MRAPRALLCAVVLTGAIAAPVAAQSPDASSPPAPGASMPAGVQPFPSAGELPPGTYTSDAAGVAFTFTVDETWPDAGELEEVGLYLAQADGSGLSMTTFPGQVFTDPCGPEPVEDREVSARSLIDFLATHPALTVLAEPTAVELGGVTGWQVDLGAALPASCTEGPRIWLWALPIVGDFHFVDGERARVVALDVGDRVAVIVAEALPGADPDTLLADAARIIGTLTVSGASPALSPSPAAS